jgi:opacity protein-like surface antigen
MQSSHRWAAVAVLVSLGVASPAVTAARAQSKGRPVLVGVQGGITLPTGDLSDCCNSGWHVGGFLQYRQPASVVGLRGELQYHRNDLKDSYIASIDPTSQASGNFSTLYFGGAGVLEVAPQGSGVGWYILAGAGMYMTKFTVSQGSVDVSADKTKFGFNGGAGLRFKMGGASLFVESRYHGVKVEDANYTFLPVSIGVSW